MQYYASATGGAYREVASTGEGTADALVEIIEACGAEVTVAFDLKPGSCPNAFNPKDKGVVPAAILGSEAFDVTTINPASVQLCNTAGACISPIRTSIEDAAQPCPPNGVADCPCCEYAPTLVYDANGMVIDSYFDNFDDLALKFAAADVNTLVAGAAIGDQVPLTVKFTADDTQFEATDCLKIVR
jgi:hypothetical protein